MIEPLPIGPSADVVSLGECMVAMVAAQPGPLAESRQFDAHVAGAEANVLVGLARLGRSTAFLGRVGDDGFGTAILHRLRGEGVDVTGVTVDQAHQTGILARSRAQVGQAELRYYRAGSAGSFLSPADVEQHAATVRSARILHVTGITPALSATCAAAVDAAVALSRGAGRMISLDVNYRRRLWDETDARAALLPLASQADVLIAGPEEAMLLIGRNGDGTNADLARGLRALGPRIVVIKAGADGATGIDNDGDPLTFPALSVRGVVDPIGAGDAFTAGLLAAILEGRPLADALRWGNACGAASVASEGDMSGMPTRTELDGLLSDATGDVLR